MSEPKNDKARKLKFKRQTEVSYAAIGKFICEFESLCQNMRLCVSNTLAFNGLKHSQISNVIVADLSANQLTKLLEGLYAENVNKWPQLKDAKDVSNKLLSEIKSLIEERNNIAHANFLINYAHPEATDFSEIKAYKLKSSKSKGSYVHVLPSTKKAFLELAEQATILSSLVLRHSYYINPIFEGRPIADDKEFKKYGYVK